jgi:hypothetical protein
MRPIGRIPKDGVLVAETPGWKLFERPNSGSGGWRSFKLISDGRRQKKANFWLGHNGQRFSVNADYSLLVENEPDVFEWVNAQVQS